VSTAHIYRGFSLEQTGIRASSVVAVQKALERSSSCYNLVVVLERQLCEVVETVRLAAHRHKEMLDHLDFGVRIGVQAHW
jgi:glycerol-3-phosphate responsive antiterminator